MKVLFICNGNIGRSQVAEGLFNKYSKKNKSISAGTDVKIPKSPGGGSIQVMKKYGIDISKNKSKQVTQKMLKEAGRIVILMEKHELNDLPDYFKKYKDKIVVWDIIDAKYLKSWDEVVERFKKIRKHVKDLIKEIG